MLLATAGQSAEICTRSAANTLTSHLVLHADARGVNHAITPVSLEDPLLLA